MFYHHLKSQFATSRWGGSRKLPYAFTEQGVAMLSGLLNSDVAIAVNIIIMRAFVAIRQLVLNPPVNEAKELKNDFVALIVGTFIYMNPNYALGIFCQSDRIEQE